MSDASRDFSFEEEKLGLHTAGQADDDAADLAALKALHLAEVRAFLNFTDDNVVVDVGNAASSKEDGQGRVRNAAPEDDQSVESADHLNSAFGKLAEELPRQVCAYTNGQQGGSGQYMDSLPVGLVTRSIQAPQPAGRQCIVPTSGPGDSLHIRGEWWTCKLQDGHGYNQAVILMLCLTGGSRDTMRHRRDKLGKWWRKTGSFSTLVVSEGSSLHVTRHGENRHGNILDPPEVCCIEFKDETKVVQVKFNVHIEEKSKLLCCLRFLAQGRQVVHKSIAVCRFDECVDKASNIKVMHIGGHEVKPGEEDDVCDLLEEKWPGEVRYVQWRSLKDYKGVVPVFLYIQCRSKVNQVIQKVVDQDQSPQGQRPLLCCLAACSGARLAREFATLYGGGHEGVVFVGWEHEPAPWVSSCFFCELVRMHDGSQHQQTLLASVRSVFQRVGPDFPEPRIFGDIECLVFDKRLKLAAVQCIASASPHIEITESSNLENAVRELKAKFHSLCMAIIIGELPNSRPGCKLDRAIEGLECVMLATPNSLAVAETMAWQLRAPVIAWPKDATQEDINAFLVRYLWEYAFESFRAKDVKMTFEELMKALALELPHDQHWSLPVWVPLEEDHKRFHRAAAWSAGSGLGSS